MPAKKKPRKKVAKKPLPAADPIVQSVAKGMANAMGDAVEKVLLDPLAGMNFPCDESAKMGAQLFEQYGQKFVAMCNPPDAVTVSWLVKVAGPTLAGKPPVLKAHANFKDRVKG